MTHTISQCPSSSRLQQFVLEVPYIYLSRVEINFECECTRNHSVFVNANFNSTNGAQF